MTDFLPARPSTAGTSPAPPSFPALLRAAEGRHGEAMAQQPEAQRRHLAAREGISSHPGIEADRALLAARLVLDGISLTIETAAAEITSYRARLTPDEARQYRIETNRRRGLEAQWRQYVADQKDEDDES